MNIGYLYFLLPIILFPIAATINVANGRKIGSQKMSMYRQIALTIIGSPVIFLLLDKGELLQKHLLLLVGCGVFGALYLSTSFYAMNLTSVGVSQTFVAVSRTLSAFIIGYTLFQESISLYDFGGVGIIFLGFAFFYKVFDTHFSKNDVLGIGLSLIGGAVFSINTLIFKTFALDFPGLQAAYLLECTSVIFLILWGIFKNRGNIKETFHIDQKTLIWLFVTAPIILTASYGAAKSIHLIPFYIFATLFILSLVMSIILSWIFLDEKFNKRQLGSLGLMVLGCTIIVIL